ncbi:hypothetical protein [Ancylobacter lacus]|uniref:hypothetical protein n=1 Tax=Ancylobacter lacus TaxID=2579970 RepID=UPI001BCD8363|nr:hypothetical protein [Ancylobacter lacus]MBS7537748.1 hypothetical protein [Ancylobacter lacus]
MKRLVTHLRDYGLAWLTGSIVVSVVVAHVLAGADTSGGAASSAGAPVAGEVKNFVLFTTVPYRDLSVTTGTTFASTVDRSVTSQWCYLSRKTTQGEPIAWVELASAKGTADPKPLPLFPNALTALGLTSSEAARLVTTHCRFQRES